MLKRILQSSSPFLFLFLLCVACTSKEEKTNQQVLRINLGSEVPTLDPRAAIDEVSNLVLAMLFEGLVRLDENSEPQLALAQSYTLSADQRTYTFKLRKARWASGEIITAHDFVYMLQTALDPDSISPNATKYYIIKNAQKIAEGLLPKKNLGVTALDQYTVRFELNHPCGYFMTLLSTPLFYPIVAQIDESHPDFVYALNTLRPTNGPFVLDTWSHREKIVLKKNTNYWDCASVRLDQVELNMIEDQKGELALFDQNKLDFAGQPVSGGLPFHALDTLAAQNKLQSSRFNKAFWYIFNLNTPYFSNKKLRKALSLAINRDRIVNRITKYGTQPAQAPLIPSYSLLTREDVAIEQEDPQLLFKEALEELGITADQLNFSISIHTDSNAKKIAETIVSQWNKAFGIHAKIEVNEWSSYIDKLFNKNFSIAALSWIPPYYDPTAFLDVFTQDSPTNFANWDNPKYDQLIYEALRTVSKNERDALLKEAEKILAQSYVVAPIYYSAPVFVTNKNLKGFVISNTGSIDFKTAYFE